MYSVIIPTMWKFEPFVKFLGDLVDVPTVGQIVIINNAIGDTPTNDILNHDKITLVNLPKNIYVNPAWNLGVEKSIFNKVCILNDDLVFDTKIFSKLFNILNNDFGGVIGLCGNEPKLDQPVFTDGTIDLIKCTTPYNHKIHFGFGMLMFLNKKHWTPIIDGLDIYWGDNFIYDTMYYKSNNNYMISNMFYHTPFNTTASTISNQSEMYANEHMVYNRDMPFIINQIWMNNRHLTGL